MSFRDTLITCQECSTQFIFRVEKQRKMADQGLEIVAPTLCDSCSQRINYGGKLHGTIKWFNPEKGYGFIVQSGGEEIFFHRNSVSLTDEGALPTLDEGQEVLYEVRDSPKGPQAVQVNPHAIQAG
jgi:CspA family cold shock protein